MHRVGGCDIRVEGKNGASFHDEWRINQSLSMPPPACQKSATKTWTLSPSSDLSHLLFLRSPWHRPVASHCKQPLVFEFFEGIGVVPKIALEASQSPVFLSVTVFSLDWRTLGQFSSVQVGSCHLAEALEGLMVAAAAGGGGGSIRPDRGSHVATSAPPHRTAQQTPALATLSNPSSDAATPLPRVQRTATWLS